MNGRFGGRVFWRGSFKGRIRERRQVNYNYRSSVECFNCHKYGHYQNECPESQEAHHTKTNKEEELLLMA